MPKIQPECVGAHTDSYANRNSNKLSAESHHDRTDNSRRRHCAFDFDDLFAVPRVEGDDETRRYAPIVVALQSAACSRGARDSLQMFHVAVVLSALSFGFVAFFFGVILHAERIGIPDGDIDINDWISCSTNASVTRLGQVLSYNTVRAKVSLPKFFEVALICTLLTYLNSQSCSVACQMGLFGFGLAAIATPIFMRPSSIGSDPLPKWVDVPFTLAIVFAMLGRLSWNCVRAKVSAPGLASRYPRLVFLGSLTAMYVFNAIVVNLSPGAMGLTPAGVIAITYVIARTFGLMARFFLKGIELPLLGNWAFCFLYDVSVATSLRRYLIGFIDGDAALAAIMTTAFGEVLINSMSMILAVRTFNKLHAHSLDLAMMHMNVCFASIASDMLSEHVALHSCFGYALFADPRMLNIGRIRGVEVVLRNWLISFCVELLVDGICVWSMILMLPVSFSGMVTSARRSTIMLVFGICATVHPHLIGLQNIVDQDRYICDPNTGL